MKLTNANTSSNEALSVRANILAELRESLGDLSPFTQAFLAIDTSGTGTPSDTTETYFMNLWRSINQHGVVEGTIGIDSDGSVKIITLRATSQTDVHQGNEIVDYFRIEAVFDNIISTIGYQNDKYEANGQTKGLYKSSTYYFQAPSFLDEEEIDVYLQSFAQQIGSVDILLSLSNLAVSGGVTYSDVMSVLGSSGSFVNPKLHGIVSQYATYLNEDNACAIINLMISDYFNDAKGYTEEDDQLKFNSLEYDFDASCLLGWHQISGIITSAITIVASIFSPIVGLVAGALGAAVSSISDFIVNADQSAPKLVPEAAHNIASLPIWQAETQFDYLNWAHRFIKRSGRLTLTTDFFKLFAWLSDENTLAMEMYVNTGYGYDIMGQWRKGMSGVAPSGSVTTIRGALNFTTDGDTRSFQTLTFPNAVGGAWNIPSYLGNQTIPDVLESSDILYSRMFNGLLLSSLYVLYSSNSSIHVVSQQTRSSSLPSSYTVKDRLLWYVGAYLDTYQANLLESSTAQWLVPGWFATLRDFASTLDASAMLNRIVGSYFDGNSTKPSIAVQDYGQVENVRTFIASTITSKGSAMIIPPMSKYSIGQKLAITAGIAAVVTVGALIASRRFRSIQARNAQNQRFKVDAAYSAYRADPTTANWTAFQKEVRSFNRWTYFNGASRVSTDDWGTLTTSISAQSAAAGDAALAALLGTEAVSETVAGIVEQQIPGLKEDNSDIKVIVDRITELIVGPSV